MKLNRLFYLLSLLFIVGCDESISFAQLCETHPEACQEFHQDTWCKKERVALVFSHAALAKNHTDEEIYNNLIAYENYEQCVSHAAEIDHIKFKEKKTKRIENMLKAREKIQQISDATINSKHPRLLYYHWSHNLNKQSLAEFLALEGKAVMETPASQYELATYYAKRDNHKTRQLLLHALELYQEGDTINIDIFKSLTSISAKMGDDEQAYIWLKVLTLAAPKEKQQIDELSMQQYQNNTDINQNYLDKVAKSILSNIENAKFVAPSSSNNNEALKM